MARERHRPAPFQRADSESGHGWLTSFRNRFRGRNLQSSVSKLLFMMGFLVNSLTMTVLFIWLNLSWTDLMRKNTEICLENWSSAYEYSIRELIIPLLFNFESFMFSNLEYSRFRLRLLLFVISFGGRPHIVHAVQTPQNGEPCLLCDFIVSFYKWGYVIIITMQVYLR